ncbi:hypothetical protein KAT24_02075 [Candidatus Pacearchaeota archaeon]|nr:hypothetical protein [Candidatus Pacearchaeota archaeon]
MRIFSFLKKLVKENKVDTTGVPRKQGMFYKGQEVVIEKLAFSDIENWIENKIKENEFKQKEIILMIKDKIKRYNNELNRKIKILEDFDVEAKREKENIKGIVNNSRKDYIRAVENFLENLNNLEINEFEEFMEKINKIFLNFNKSSSKNYERATILIGKEMASIKESLRAFSKELLKTYEENKDVGNFFKTISQIKSKYQNIKPIDNALNTTIEKKVSLNKKISEKEEENRILKEKVEEIKRGQNYLDFLANQKRVESLKSESKKDILELKQLLDFKALANFFHINEEQMNILKNHKEDFYTNFQKDNGKMIIDLLDEAKLNNNTILEKVNLIRTKIEETSNYEREIKEDETQELYPKIKEIVLEIDKLKIEKAKEEKRYEKLKISKEELISVLKEELGKMNVEVV